MLESGIIPIKEQVLRQRKTFLQKKLENSDLEEPFNFVYSMCRNQNTPGYRLLANSLQENDDARSLDRIAEYVHERSLDATKMNTYVSDFNPSLTVREVYSSDRYIPDFYRTSFTRLRLMSHNLRVETGRWSRIPPHLRTCPCDGASVQLEDHVLISCTMTESCRNNYRMLTFSDIRSLMTERNHILELCKYVYDVLQACE